METQKYDFFFSKSSKLNFDLWRRAEITLASSISVLTPTLVIDTSMERSSSTYYSLETQMFEFHKIKTAKARKNSSVSTFRSNI